jgi:nucleoside-diphosphate-sugar epimerase
MKILVMGGSRFNGRALVDELLDAGHDVTIFNRGQTSTDLPRGVHQLLGDRKDHAALREVLGEQEFDVIHDTSAYVLEDVENMVELFEGRTAHYIFASSCAVYDPVYERVLPIKEDTPLNWSEANNNAYGRNKAICEKFLVERYRRGSFPASITRYPMVYGPRNFSPYRETMMFTRLLLGRPVLVPGDGTTLSHMSYVRDQAKALRKMMLNPLTFGQAYNMASTEYFSDESYIDVLSEIVGVEAAKIFLPPELTDEAYATLPYPLMQRHGVRLVDWRKNSVFSTRKFEEHVGYAQEHTFWAGMQETYDWFVREGVQDRLEFDFSHEDALIERVRSGA